MRVESSILASLSELRDIEKQRIADERSAIERTRRAEIEAKLAAEQAVREAEAARVRAENDERVRIEVARAEAEREARMRVQAAEASERARYQAALDQQRLAQEMELRRAEVLRKRPTWMVAVTACAFVAAIGLTWFAIDRSQKTAVAEEKQRIADAERARSKQMLIEAAARLKVLEDGVAELDQQVSVAQQKLASAQNEADRKAAREAIALADKRRADAKRAANAARAAEEKRIRDLGIHIDPKCVKDPVGCLRHK
jgi:hypothetical protein